MIPVEQAKRLAQSLNDDRILNLFAQADARSVLYEARELPENFPFFDESLDESVTIGAYALLSVGCSLLEADRLTDGFPYLEQGAALLENVHRQHIHDAAESAFHCLIAGMAYYAAGQYSRAFVVLKAVETRTPTAALVAAYLRKNRQVLMSQLSELLLDTRSTL